MTEQNPDWYADPLDTGRWRWTSDMSEVSGFGGTYEAGCRAMVQAGLQWFEENPDADPVFKSATNTFGLLIDVNEHAEELEKAMMDAEISFPEDAEEFAGETIRIRKQATGAMHQAAIETIMWIRQNSWDEYEEMMKEHHV